MDNTTETTFGKMIHKIIQNRRQMVQIMDEHGGLFGFFKDLSLKLKIKDTDTDESLLQDFMDALKLRQEEISANALAWAHGTVTSDQPKAEKIARIIEHGFLL